MPAGLQKSQPRFRLSCLPGEYTVPTVRKRGDQNASRVCTSGNASVRVSVTKNNQESCSVDYPERLDLREDPGSLARLEAARQHPSLRGLLLNLNADESPFSTFSCKLWSDAEAAGAEPNVFASRIGLVVSQGAREMSEAGYEDLARRLAELLEREPGDALRVELQTGPAQFAGGRQGSCLRLVLYARGAAPEQAQLRWSLGLARVQQALLFLARAIRQNRVSAE